MKRVNNVFEKMTQPNVLKKAILNASKGKTSLKHVLKVLNNIDAYVFKLRELLITESYIPSKPRIEVIQCIDKKRTIKKVDFFPDRCIEHAIAYIMLPKWNNVISHDTFASWKGRGINTTDGEFSITKRIKRYINSYNYNKPLYAFKFDIKKCYENVDNDILDKINEKYCKDEKLINLMKVINHSDEGLEIGRYISQLWINVYLTELDNFIKHTLHVKHYVRYMDDGLIISDDKHLLLEYKWRIMNFLWYTLHMELNSKRLVFKIGKYRGERPIDMCGYCFYRSFTLLRKRVKHSMLRKLNQPESMTSYNGLLLTCECTNLRRKYNIKLTHNKKHKRKK